MTKPNLLLLEDDLSLGQSLVENLNQDGFLVHWEQTLAKAIDKVTTTDTQGRTSWDLAILDLGLPDGSGFVLAKKIAGKIPILLMTALNTAENRLEGLELGASEFIPKPFLYKELRLRVLRMLATDSRSRKNCIHLPNVELDLDKMCVKSKTGFVFLAPKDFRVLDLLIRESPKALHRDEILNSVWGAEQFPTNRTVDNTIVRLREVLQDTEGLLIRSVRGIGYQWIYEEKI